MNSGQSKILKITLMKPEVKYWSHEVEYVVLTIVTLVFLSFVIFPLFIAFLPLALIIGCSVVWNADHLNNKK
jgi:hypothetical protein